MLLADHSEGDDDDDDDDHDNDDDAASAAAADDDDDADLMPDVHGDDYHHRDDENDLDDDGIVVMIIILQIMVEMTDGCQCQMPCRKLERFEAARSAAEESSVYIYISYINFNVSSGGLSVL